VDYETLPNSVTIPAGDHTARIVGQADPRRAERTAGTVLLAIEPDPSLGRLLGTRLASRQGGGGHC